MQILGTNDAITSCECCGKSGLKFTVAVLVNGEVMHYGSTCATHHTGKTPSQIKIDIANELTVRKTKAKNEFEKSNAHISLQVALNNARKIGLIGKEFKKACLAEIESADKVKQDIANKYKLEPYQF